MLPVSVVLDATVCDHAVAVCIAISSSRLVLLVCSVYTLAEPPGADTAHLLACCCENP